MSATSVAFMVLGCSTYRECLQVISGDDVLDHEFQEIYGVFAGTALRMVEHGMLNEPALDVLVYMSKKVDSPFDFV
jgi:hypothetical protein